MFNLHFKQQIGGAFSAIVIDKTASLACKISYCLTEQAYLENENVENENV